MIPLPKGLYFTAAVFCFCFFLILLLFSTPNLRGHWTDLNRTWMIHVHLWLQFDKYGPNTPGHLPPRVGGGKKRFLGPTLNFDRRYLCNEKWYQQLERHLPIYEDCPTWFRNLVNFGPEMAENCWRVLPPPLNFRIGRHCQPYRMDVLYNRQQTNFGTRYVVAWGYSLEQQLVLLILHAHLPRDGGLLLFICHLFIKLVYAYR